MSPKYSSGDCPILEPQAYLQRGSVRSPSQIRNVEDLLKGDRFDSSRKLLQSANCRATATTTQAQLVERLLSEVDSARLQQVIAQDAAA